MHRRRLNDGEVAVQDGLASSSFTVCQMGSNTAWCFGKIGIQTIYLFKELLGNEKKLGQKDYRYEQS